MEKKKTILISFQNHKEADGRVFYRELRYITDKFDNTLSIKMLSVVYSDDYATINVVKDSRIYQNHDIAIYRICAPLYHTVFEQANITKKIHVEVRNILREINPDIFFIADVRELPDAVKVCDKAGNTVLYDSHEDYVRQALDYGTGLKKYIKAVTFFLYELFYIRKCRAVFCTDEFLQQKYRNRLYHAKQVVLMRNYPYYDASVTPNRRFEKKDNLKMVYIGGVDKFRGIIQAAEFIERFNSEHVGLTVTLDIYGNDTEVARTVRENSAVQFHDWIDQNELMQKLRSEFDVGLCLWQPIPKFFLNLPLKNFDYMGAGLPFITSNFGNLKIHAERSKAGYCIDPNSYEDFERCTLELFDPEVRKNLSQNGLRYAREDASFQKEAEPLIEIIRETYMQV